MVGGTLFCVGCGEKVKIENKRKEKSKRMVRAMVPFDKTFPERATSTPVRVSKIKTRTEMIAADLPANYFPNPSVLW